MSDYTRIPIHNRMRRNIAINITIRSYHDIITYLNSSYDGCIDANPYLITDVRNTFIFASIRLPDDYTLVNVAIPPNRCGWINGDIIGMA